MSVQHLNKEYKVIRTTGRTDTKDIVNESYKSSPKLQQQHLKSR